MSYHVLLVDDDQELLDLLGDYLAREGLRVTVAHTGASGVEITQRLRPDLVVLDVMMPGGDGIEALRRLRADSSVPVLMLTARGDDEDRILGLELGADDYVAKPCTPRELLARIRSILRRTVSVAGAVPQDLVVGPLTLSLGQRLARVQHQAIELTSTEFTLLELLLRQPGRLVTKAELSRAGLGRPFNRYDRSIDMHMSRIRHKLAQVLGTDHLPIKTVVSKGYQWVLE